MRIFQRHPSPATVISIIALFVSLGGVGYAAIKLPANSVTSKQIKSKSVKNSDLAKNAVTSDKVKDGTLGAGDFAAGVLPPTASPAVSSFANKSDLGMPPLGMSFGEVVELTDGVNGGLLTLPWDGRITANASVHVGNTTPSSGGAICRLEISSGGSYTDFSGSSMVGFVSGLYDGTISLSSGIDVPAGTYDVRVACRKTNGESVYYDHAGVTAVATRR